MCLRKHPPPSLPPPCLPLPSSPPPSILSAVVCGSLSGDPLSGLPRTVLVLVLETQGTPLFWAHRDGWSLYLGFISCLHIARKEISPYLPSFLVSLHSSTHLFAHLVYSTSIS